MISSSTVQITVEVIEFVGLCSSRSPGDAINQKLHYLPSIFHHLRRLLPLLSCVA